MDSHFSNMRWVGGKPSTKSKDEKTRFLSDSVSEFIARKLEHPPLKLKLIEMYNALYERLFGPWSRLVGSYADNLSISSSDIDMVLDRHEIYSSPDAIPDEYNHGLVIHTDDPDIPPGCCVLRAYQRDLQNGNIIPSDAITYPYVIQCGFTKRLRVKAWKLIDVKGSKCVSSLDHFHQNFEEGLTQFPIFNNLLPNWQPHGPAFRQTYFGIFDVDIVPCFSCKTLPRVLLGWVRRQRNTWPTLETIEQALEQGCHVIGLPSKITPHEQMQVEWRLGYGDMEKILTKSLNGCQKQCYILLKIILKEHIEPNFQNDDILSSYVMKTLIFWMAEETEPDIWERSNLLICLQMCLEKLCKWVDAGYCPNYFIPEYNLFRTKVEVMHEKDFSNWLRTTVGMEWKIVMQCKSMNFLEKLDREQ